MADNWEFIKKKKNPNIGEWNLLLQIKKLCYIECYNVAKKYFIGANLEIYKIDFLLVIKVKFNSPAMNIIGSAGIFLFLWSLW